MLRGDHCLQTARPWAPHSAANLNRRLEVCSRAASQLGIKNSAHKSARGPTLAGAQIGRKWRKIAKLGRVLGCCVNTIQAAAGKNKPHLDGAHIQWTRGQLSPAQVINSPQPPQEPLGLRLRPATPPGWRRPTAASYCARPLARSLACLLLSVGRWESISP